MSRRGRLAFRIALGLVVVALVVVGIGWYQVTDRPTGNPARVTVEIPAGAGHDVIMARLEAANLAPHPLATRLVFKWKGTFPKVRAGTYVVAGDADALELADALAGETRGQALTIIPGQSAWEAAERIAAAGFGARADALALIGDERFARDELGLGDLVGPARGPRPDGVAPTWLEGFLFPDTYELLPGATARDALVRAVTAFRHTWDELVRAHPRALADRARDGLSAHDVLVVASLVEEESAAPEEAARIAGVFYNRLRKGMRLETDPTLMYRPDRVGRAPTPAERRDATNPYNTYAIAGLPPGPICSPGRTALLAALEPEAHDYLFFVARRDGTGRHAFASTFEDHKANIDRYLRKAAPAPE